MSTVTADDFKSFFEELHGYNPYRWQEDFAQRIVDGDWPAAIDLPTACGKTAAIDMAVFALACQASLPVEQRTAQRRIFFCVNRRVIVDEAFGRSRRIAQVLWKAEHDDPSSVLGRIAAALRQVAGEKPNDRRPPLDVLELRGGIYRDNRWASSATQPSVICTTVDQLGSRLLFRGYGVSHNAAPIQAAMIAYDSLIYLDEAHISTPFLQTLQQVRTYLNAEKWAAEDIGAQPSLVIPMTATPPSEDSERSVFKLNSSHREVDQSLEARLAASKIAVLAEVSKGSLVTRMATKAEEMADKGARAIGIIVNRVATAKEIHAQLLGTTSEKRNVEVELMIGSMRPLDRDAQVERLRRTVGPKRERTEQGTTTYVVATQCIEVGADFDFDALVTECASLDALRQRFGRLDRTGRRVTADGANAVPAAVFIAKQDAKAGQADAIYGDALPLTWKWLNDHGQPMAEVATGVSEEPKTKRKKQTSAPTALCIDFGVDAMNALLQHATEDGRIPMELLAPSAKKNAPVMLPAYVDFWCQTSPRPVPDPDVSLFIHGSQASEPDVQVCWRADLEKSEKRQKVWTEAVSLVPPTAAECMSIPISRVRRWLGRREMPATDTSDLLGAGSEADTDAPGVKQRRCHPGVLWRGLKESMVLSKPQDLRPGDTLVLPTWSGGWEELGHVPHRAVLASTQLNGSDDTEDTQSADGPDASIAEQPRHLLDIAEEATRIARSQMVVRIHPTVCAGWPEPDAYKELVSPASANGERLSLEEIKALLPRIADELDAADTRSKRMAKDESAVVTLASTAEALRHLSSDATTRVAYYPDGRGLVLRCQAPTSDRTLFAPSPLDDGDDDTSQTKRRERVALTEHTKHVQEALSHCLPHLRLCTAQEVLPTAVCFHDWGKADERFQALLLNSDRTDAFFLISGTGEVWAKSAGLPGSYAEWLAARDRAQLPAGFRHEMLSVQLAERSDKLPTDPRLRDLALHLIAAHHGYARPLAPVVVDDNPPDVEIDGVRLTGEDRLARPAHRLDSGIAERFWSLTRHFGWWGLAYLEAVLRLADQQASRDEDLGRNDEGANSHLQEASR